MREKRRRRRRRRRRTAIGSWMKRTMLCCLKSS